MTKRPSRPKRSVSITGATYDRLKAYCDEQGITMAALVEALTADVGVKS